MKKILLFSIWTLSFFCSTAYSQNFWQAINDPCLFASTQAMIVANNSNVIASGCNPIRYSTNGTSWNSATGNGSTNVIDKFVVAANGDIYGSANYLLKSTDNGLSWTTISAYTFGNNITDFAINSNGDIFALVLGVVYKSTDNGSSWVSINSEFTNPLAISIAINSSDEIFIGTNTWNTGGQIYRSTDNGANWSPMASTLFSGVSINIIKIVNNKIYIGTQGMGLYRSLDNGTTWTSINSDIPGTSNWISDIISNSSGDVFVSVGYKGVFKSSNDGNSWSDISSGLQTSGSTVRSPTALAVNSSGIIFAGTNDYGTYQSNSSTLGINDMSTTNIFTNVYPNPTKENIILEITEDVLNKPLKMILRNNLGESVKEIYINSTITNIQLEKLSTGIYLYQLTSDNLILKTGKIIIQ